MKAVVYHHYGDRQVMAMEDVADPGAPGPGDVRVRVCAASINPVDGKVRRGALKLIAGGHFPKRPGLDFSGIVEAVGDRVAGFAVGDAVFGAARSMSDGSFAERTIVHARSIAPKPASLDHATAAGVPTVGIAALQSLRDIVKVQRGDPLLVNGCTGGVGLFALQIARHFGAATTGVCGTDGVALAREFGAGDIIDYRQADVMALGPRFRAILELSGKLSFDQAQSLLVDGGCYVDFSPTPAALVGGSVANVFRHRRHAFAMTAPNRADLDWLAQSIDAGTLRAAPTQHFPFTDFADAFAVAEGGGTIGKIVVVMEAVD